MQAVCVSCASLSLSFPGTHHGVPAPGGPRVTQPRHHCAHQTSAEHYSGETNKGLSQSLSDRRRQYTLLVMKPLMAHTYAQTHTHTATALNPSHRPSWSSRSILDCVKNIMGQTERKWWGECVFMCICVCYRLIDEMLSLRVSVMMTITRGRELRQLWLLSIQIGALTGLLLKFFFFLLHFSSTRVW